MSARFTETEKWSDPWFQSLPHGAKLLFMYLCDRCNAAGFYEENRREACFHLGIEDKQYEGALKGLARGIVSMNGWLWVKNFLKHQKNKDLNPENPAHRGIIRLLQEQVERFSESPEFKAFVDPLMGLLRPLCNGKGIGKGEGNGGREVKERGARFSAPTLEDVVGEMTRQGVLNASVEAEKYISHYSSNGWKVGGKAAMKDWKSAVTTWKHRLNGNGSNSNGVNGHAPKRIPTAAEAYGG